MPALATADAAAPPTLRDLADPPGVLAGMLASERLRRAGGFAPADVRRLLALAVRGDDHLVRAGALRVLSAVPGPEVDRALLRALDADAGLAEHAAWALAGRGVLPGAVRPLLGLVQAGGFGGVLALATLEAWAAEDRTGLVGLTSALLGALRRVTGPARADLVGLLGLAGGTAAGNLLRALALDRDEASATRAAAVTALAGRHVPGGGELLRRLAADPDPAVRGAVLRARSGGPAGPRQGPRRGGLRVAQVLVQGRLDGDLRSAGTGDGGGLVTLLVNLARELATQPAVEEVVTLARDPGGRDEGARPAEAIGLGARIAWLQVGATGPLPAPALWSHRREIEAELARTLRAAAPDVVHLRATDGGAWAALRVCRRLGLPYVFTVAPDPANVIRAAERAGALDRSTFAAADAAEHWWFRIGLLGDLVEGAAALVTFPRPGGAAALAELTGLDLPAGAATVVPEGASLRASAAAEAVVAGVAAGDPPPLVLADLAAGIDGLAPGRRGLPLLVTAGRLHPVKGVDRLVAAWAGTPALRDGFNLVVVGGDLAAPSPVERGVLAAVEAALARHPGGDGLVLLGARPHADVALVLAAARTGLAPGVGPDGVYVCASVKEEFGLALVEALAAGLPVVGPDEGGPPTYIEDGVDGALVDTSSTAALAEGIARAAALRHDAARAARARARIAAEVSLTGMAAALAAVYREVAGPPAPAPATVEVGR